MKLNCCVLLYVHRNHKDYQGRGAQDGYRNFHAAPELCFVWSSVAVYVVVKSSDQQKTAVNFPLSETKTVMVDPELQFK